jgi:hypothetical protein
VFQQRVPPYTRTLALIRSRSWLSYEACTSNINLSRSYFHLSAACMRFIWSFFIPMLS